MANIGAPELLVILVIALLLFGPQRLAGIGAALGKTVREFRNAVRDVEEAHDASAPVPPKTPQ